MTSVTTKAFGYIIAFILPGSAALYTISLWSPWARGFISNVLSSDTKASLVVVASLIALGVGLLVSLVSALLFDASFRATILPRKSPSAAVPDFGRLWREGRLEAVEALSDQALRYFQFWAGIAVVLPCFVISVIAQRLFVGFSIWSVVFALLVLAFELLLIRAAQAALKRYSTWRDQVLQLAPGMEAGRGEDRLS